MNKEKDALIIFLGLVAVADALTKLYVLLKFWFSVKGV